MDYIIGISTHSLTRRLTAGTLKDSVYANIFQLTASRGGWREKIYLIDELYVFQLTASRGGWRSNQCPCHRGEQFQLTASRGGWQLSVQKFLDNLGISTHSLTRRLTICLFVLRDFNSISTHSLTRRLTDDGIPILYAGLYFNSQPHEEADSIYGRFNNRKYISTHSLTRRLTSWKSCPGCCKEDFNSQPHEEADGIKLVFLCEHGISTHSLTRRLTLELVLVFIPSCISTHSLTRRLTAILNKNHFI